MDQNELYYGDNLDVMRRYLADASVDLVYLDPPFNSSRDFNAFFAEQDGSRAVAGGRIHIVIVHNRRRDDGRAILLVRIVPQQPTVVGGNASDATPVIPAWLHGQLHILPYPNDHGGDN